MSPIVYNYDIKVSLVCVVWLRLLILIGAFVEDADADVSISLQS